MSEDTGVDALVAWPVADVAELRVRRMQIKLHRWAVADHGFRFDDVFNFVCDPAVLVMAFERVAGNTGARTPGVDGVRADHVRSSGAEAYLDHIRTQLKAGAFRPVPVRERMIPKTGGKLRRLGIPTIADRVVQAALKLVLEPIFEADFRPCSYGFRPNRRAHDAIAEIHLFGSQGYRWVLDADIEACFDRIDHTALMDRVRARVKDRRVLALVKAFLKAGIMTELGEREETDSGTPQGGILSPLLANIALPVLDDFGFAQVIGSGRGALPGHGLLAKGVGLLECSRRLQLALNTVKRYARADRPERMLRVPKYRAGRSIPTASTCANAEVKTPASPSSTSSKRSRLSASRAA
jgi:RNA-directed DNA polymerase